MQVEEFYATICRIENSKFHIKVDVRYSSSKPSMCVYS